MRWLKRRRYSRLIWKNCRTRPCFDVLFTTGYSRNAIGKAHESLPIEYPRPAPQPVLEPNEPTAVFVVGSCRWGGVYALDWVRREFPGHFRYFVLMSARTVDAKCYSGSDELEQERRKEKQR
jgi:hypothetical protein